MKEEIAVAIDVGSRRHAVGVGTSDGGLIEEFEIGHDRVGVRCPRTFPFLALILIWASSRERIRFLAKGGTPRCVSELRDLVHHSQSSVMGRVAKLFLLVQTAVGCEYETAGDQVPGRVILSTAPRKFVVKLSDKHDKRIFTVSNLQSRIIDHELPGSCTKDPARESTTA